jgi:biotin carboxyl carrier protein
VSDVGVVAGAVAFLVKHASHVARVSRGSGSDRISMGGRNYTVVHDAVDSDRPAAAAGGDGRLEAPMPGSIVAVHVKTGDRVKAGQPVVVLESMKMHNEIVAPHDGVVRHVGCRAGEQVPFGLVLVEIETEAP